jgi:hypothetical protein
LPILETKADTASACNAGPHPKIPWITSCSVLNRKQEAKLTALVSKIDAHLTKKTLLQCVCNRRIRKKSGSICKIESDVIICNVIQNNVKKEEGLNGRNACVFIYPRKWNLSDEKAK